MPTPFDQKKLMAIAFADSQLEGHRPGKPIAR